NNKWINPNDVLIRCNGEILINSKDGNDFFQKHPGLNSNRDIELIRFWKLDKNENEMFAGDIIKLHQFLFDGNEIEEESIAEVTWGEDGFCLKLIKSNFIKGYIGNDNHELAVTGFFGLHEESFEIIGNIYENPELLEVRT
ncbi:MAG: YopX family protein, partial [Victivallales bacterium]|nr:YopX family protein [Victivallales bacterium]